MSSSYRKKTKNKTFYNDETDEEKENRWKVWIRPETNQTPRETHRVLGWLVGLLVGLLTGWLVGWFVSGLVGCLVDRLPAWFRASHEQAVRLSGRAANL